ncbi:hypothetical protein ES319_D10G123100v1 [Gossypium barbadense]|uniref:Uncharacterized protein n=1 Tax=Gossypium barbadense TaxID=3634 RepID=A0A5J5PQY7_GOSBA|nr:hypothetical protein ES319_D10G123100v1 [Gossypium barbadense]KAB2008797.1 hypothetical protein ES319_D10G123100v1 [Gossypium barbadense]
MASPSDCPDQSQPDPIDNPNPPQESLPETLPSQDKLDDQEDLLEDEPNADYPDLSVPSSPPNTDLHVTTPTGSRRGGGPKRKKAATKRRAQEKKAQKKLEMLTEVFNPIPFLPNKTLDFSSHESLLKRLGLWDFVHLDFDGNLRADLIAQLIATYNPQSRGSYVNGYRIGVNRADLARALNLSVKKDKDKDSILDIEESKESVGFLEEFVSNWVLLHEDTWMMPAEVLNWTKMIKEGHFEKIDWAGLIWFMVEKELTSAPKLGNCYYASHMQCLIKYQKEELLLEKPEKDAYEAKEEEEEHNVPEDFKTSADLVDESHGGSQLEEHNIELSLGGQDNLMNKDDAEKEAAVGDEDAMDCEESKGDGPQDVQWNLDGDSYMDVGGENFLRPCNLGDVDMVEERKQEKGEEGEMEEGGGGNVEEQEDHEEQDVQDEQEEQHEEGFTISPKGDNLEAVHSANLLEGMETADVPFTTGLHIRDNSSGEFLVSRVDARTVPAVSSFLSNGNKREIGHENDISHNSLNLSNKRLRTDEQWDKSSDFDTCMEQMQHWMDKARMLYAAKDQACGDSSMHQQVLLHELQRRDTLIEHLQKAKFEEQQKRQMEVYRLERELYLMENLLDGYRKALKETNRTFAEYRARCPLPDEPLYKDVTGSGGLVLSTREIEKLRLKQEEEDRLNRLLTENKIKDFEAGWIRKFDAHRDAVSLLSDKLTNAENEVKLLKELCNRKVSAGTPECVPNESGMSSQ